MGSFRLAKSVKLGKGVRLNLSKTGIGISAGVPGARYSVHSSGRRTTSVGVPGTGVSYRDTRSSGRRASSGSSARSAPVPMVPVYPKAGLLAPKEDKLFVQGVTAYMQGRFDDALRTFQDVAKRDEAGAHVGEEFLAGMTLVGMQRLPEAIPYLETVLASDQSIPDPRMSRYGVGGEMAIAVTEAVSIRLLMSNLAVALMLAEAYQRVGRQQQAIDLLETLGAMSSEESAFALSLADLYAEMGNWRDVVRVTEGVRTNEDDVSCNLLGFRAYALVKLGMTEAALEITKEALRFKKRTPELLWFARYVRGLAYDAAGKAGLAKKEFEKVYAQNANYGDVAQRLGLR